MFPNADNRDPGEARRIKLGLTGLALLAAAMLIGRIWEGDEKLLYAAVAKSILHTGDWIVMHVGNVPYFNKPPLAFWCTAVFFKLFGVSVAPSRAFAVSCSIGAVFLTYLMVRAFRDQNEALLAAAILSLTPTFVARGSAGVLEGPEVCWMMLAVCGYVWGTAGEKHWPLVGIGIGCGLGVLTKSPFILLLLPVFAVHAAATGRLRRLSHTWLWVGLLLGAAVAVPWFVEVARRQPSFLAHHFKGEMMDRLIGEGDFAAARNSRLKYFVSLLKKEQPWISLAAAGVILGFRSIKRGVRDYPLLLILWVGVLGGSIYAMSRITYKYHVPIFPATSALAAFAAYRWLPERHRSRLPYYVFSISVVALAVAALVPYQFYRPRYEAVRTLIPTVRTLVPPEGQLVGHRLLDNNAIDRPEIAAFYYFDRHLTIIDDPSNLLELGPEVVWAEREAFEANLASRGYRAVVSQGQLVIGVHLRSREDIEYPGS